MAVAAEALVRDKLYIGGEWVDPAGDGTIDVRQPVHRGGRGPGPGGHRRGRGSRGARGACGVRLLVEHAGGERADYLGAIGAKLGERGDELAALISTEMGMPSGSRA